jgi:hypothetical protein
MVGALQTRGCVPFGHFTPGYKIGRADGAGALAKGWRSSFRSQTIIAARSRALVARDQLKYFSGFTSENFESVIN